MLRSGTSVGANYRSARRARSDAEFISRPAIVEEEADETIYWLDLIEKAGLQPADRIHPIRQECNEILSMIVASIKKVKARLNRS